MRAHQLRSYLSAAAYVPIEAFGRLALSSTEWPRAMPDYSSATTPPRCSGARHRSYGRGLYRDQLSASCSTDSNRHDTFSNTL